MRCGVRLPAALCQHDQAVFDIMDEWCRRYTVGNGMMISLDDLLRELGIPSHKETVSGEMIPELYAAGQFGTIVTYGLLDVLAEEDAFLRMLGERSGVAPPAGQTAPAPEPDLVSAIHQIPESNSQIPLSDSADEGERNTEGGAAETEKPAIGESLDARGPAPTTQIGPAPTKPARKSAARMEW
jgi:hypothetical protein